MVLSFLLIVSIKDIVIIRCFWAIVLYAIVIQGRKFLAFMAFDYDNFLVHNSRIKRILSISTFKIKQLCNEKI